MKTYVQRQYAKYENTQQAVGGFWDFDWVPGLGGKSTAQELRAQTDQLMKQSVPSRLPRKEAARLLLVAKNVAKDVFDNLLEEVRTHDKSKLVWLKYVLPGNEDDVTDRWNSILNDYGRNINNNVNFLQLQLDAGNLDGALWKRHLVRFYQGTYQTMEAIQDKINAQYLFARWGRSIYKTIDVVNESIQIMADAIGNILDVPEQVFNWTKYAMYASVGAGVAYLLLRK